VIGFDNEPTASTDNVDTTVQTKLREIWLGNDDTLNVTGSNNLTVIASSGTVNLNDTGNDLVELANGGIVTSGAGHDTLIAVAGGSGPGGVSGGTLSFPSGAETLVAGTGAHSMLLDQSTGGGNMLNSGLGTRDMVIDASAAGGDQILAGGSYNTVIAEANDMVQTNGGSHDTILGGMNISARGHGGSNFISTDVAGAVINDYNEVGDTLMGAGDNQTLTDQVGGNTIIAAGANDTINVSGTGADTIYGNSTTVLNSSDVSTDLLSSKLNSKTGITTLTFGDGQVLKTFGISQIDFSNGVNVAITTVAKPQPAAVASAEMTAASAASTAVAQLTQAMASLGGGFSVSSLGLADAQSLSTTYHSILAAHAV
jgi:hypothetical protein